MENAPLNTLMIETLRRTTSSFPYLRAQLEAYLEMKAKADERGEDGKHTAAARKARETLRNPLLVQMPLKRASRQHEKSTRKRKAKAEKIIAEALVTFVDYDQYQIELDILNEDNPAIDADVPPSRERTDHDKIDAMVRPFIERLINRGNAPSTIGRLTDLPTDLIARLIADLRDDPDFQNPKNLWVQMMRAGILDAFAGSMTPEEAAAIDYARKTLKDDVGAAEFARAAREDCGLPAGFSTSFLEGLYHLRSCLAEVSEGQARAYARAHRLVHDRDVDLLGDVLRLNEQGDLDRLQALAHFVSQRRDYETRDTAFTIQLVAVQSAFERLEAHNRSTKDWARDVIEMIASLAEDFVDTVPSAEAFEMLLASGFRLSSTHEEIARLAECRRQEERHDMFLDDIRFACSADQRFKVVGHTVHLEWDEGFEKIDASICRIGRLSSPGAAPMIERFMPEDGLTSPVAVPVLEDREGNIWIGTNVGLNRLRPVSAVTVLKVGEDSARSFRLTAANDGIVYVASGRMLYRVVPEGDLELLRKLPEPIGFLEADGKDLVIGQGNSIVRLAKGSIVRPRYPPAPSEIVSWGADAQGQIWITADNFGGYRLSPGGWVAASLADQKLAGRFVFSHTVTKSSDWLYAQDHLLRRVGPLFETVTTKGPGLGHITIVSEGRSGPLVGGELGLARLGRSHFQTISTAREPALRGISGILQTPDCEVWINGVRGLLRTTCDDLKIAFDNPGKRLRYKQFSAADGLPGVAQQNGNGSTLARGGDGRIWIANNLGVAWIDPARTITNRLPPPVQIRKLEANGRIFADVDRVELPAGTRNVRIAYVAPSLAASERIIFRYKPVGVDRDWVEAGTRRDAFYANLPAGKWQFQVIAANSDGVWNKQGDSLSISIAPQYYETTWFRLLCIVLVLATVWLIYNWRVRQHRSHARDLAEAQLGERERIARELHDTLLQGVQGLMLRFQAATNAMSPGSREHVLAERALERADDLIIQARDRVRGLRARERSGELVSLMKELAAQYRSDGLSVSISFQDRLEPLAPELAEQVLAIVAEALANILHHAQASEVTIEIDRGRTHQTVVITDDGIGFPIEVIADSGRAGHFGIQGMMERANAFGGWLRIENSAELGARVVLGIRLSPFRG